MHYDTKSKDFKNISEGLIETFRKAGHESIEIEKKGLKIKNKEDGSPVTNGDLRVNEIICEKINIIDGDQIIAALATRWKNKKSGRDTTRNCL